MCVPVSSLLLSRLFPFFFFFSSFLFFYYASALKDKRWAHFQLDPSLSPAAFQRVREEGGGNSCRAFCLLAKIRTHLRSRYCPLIRTRQDGEQRRLNCLTRNLFQHNRIALWLHPLPLFPRTGHNLCLNELPFSYSLGGGEGNVGA